MWLAYFEIMRAESVKMLELCMCKVDDFRRFCYVFVILLTNNLVNYNFL